MIEETKMQHKLLVGTGPYAWRHAVCSCGELLSEGSITPTSTDVMVLHSIHLRKHIAHLESENAKLREKVALGKN